MTGNIRSTLCLNSALVIAFLLTSCGDSGELQNIQSVPEQYDTDGDGQLSETERNVMSADFIEKFDEDGNGELDAIETAKARRQSRVIVRASSPAPSTPEAIAAFLARFDSNDDGQISEEEAGEKRWKVMATADSNNDGQISVEEWQQKTASLVTPSASQ